MERSFSEIITDWFGPILVPLFEPINNFLNGIYMPWARACALGLFIAAMVWVYTMRREYVNVDAPSEKWWHDLRIWTVVSMVPHLIVYLFL